MKCENGDSGCTWRSILTLVALCPHSHWPPAGAADILYTSVPVFNRPLMTVGCRLSAGMDAPGRRLAGPGTRPKRAAASSAAEPKPEWVSLMPKEPTPPPPEKPVDHFAHLRGESK